jgi:hypothetical protein
MSRRVGIMSNRAGLVMPCEGQSHWCDSKRRDGEHCLNIVRNDSKRCAAGHKNKLRPIDTTLSQGLSRVVL